MAASASNTCGDTSAKQPVDSPQPGGRRRRVLLVTYTFPPVGGAGVQRVAKFAKYLPRHGWDVSVLTAANPSVPTFDHELAKEVPAETRILHARTLEPSYAVKSAIGTAASSRSVGVAGRVRAAAKRVARNVAGSLLQPDPQILWRRDALRVGLKALREERHDAILVSGPPFSAFCIAAELSRRTGTPLVLDYRDEWDLSNRYWENKRLGPLTMRLQQRMQRKVLRSANAVVATTPASAADLERICKASGGRANTICIYNGYDADDFSASNLESRCEGDQLRLTYVGTLWNLTTIAPLVEAIELLQRDTPELAKRLRLVIAGRRTPGEQAIVDRLKPIAGLLEEHTYVDHHQALNLMKGSDLLCVLLANVPGAGRVMPAKVFEYLATGIPILAIAPHGEMTQVLERAPNAHAISPADVPAIHDFLRVALKAFEPDRPLSRVAGDYPQFERSHQAGELAELLTRVVAASPAQA